jgi:hypothetical protein
VPNFYFEEEKTNMFGVKEPMEESSHALVIGELYAFKRLLILPFAYADSLSCWWSHKNRFPNFGFLVKKILGIPGSHIDIECVFNLVGVLKALQYYCLQVESLDQIIMVVKFLVSMING